MLSSAPILTYYNADDLTKVSVDSFPLIGVLLQKRGNEWRTVFCASRLLTLTEQRYAQLEKEAFVVTWCCKKFADFLVELAKFIIETNHKPLLILLKKNEMSG